MCEFDKLNICKEKAWGLGIQTNAPSMIHGPNAVAPSPLAEDEDTTRSIPANRTLALRCNDGHGTCSRVFSRSKCDIPRKEVTEEELGLGEYTSGRPRIP